MRGPHQPGKCRGAPRLRQNATTRVPMDSASLLACNGSEWPDRIVHRSSAPSAKSGGWPEAVAANLPSWSPNPVAVLFFTCQIMDGISVVEPRWQLLCCLHAGGAMLGPPPSGWKASRFRCLVMPVLVMGLIRSATAQRVTVRVVDSVDGGGLQGALIRFQDTLGSTLAEGRTNGHGTLSGSVYADAVLLLTVVRIGYKPLLALRLRLSADNADTIVVALLRIPSLLPPLVVEAAPSESYLVAAGYYERRRLGFGHFLDPEQVEERSRGARDIADLLVNIPGVDLLQFGSGRIGSVVHVTGMNSVARACRVPRVFVDGMLILDSHESPADVVGQLEQVVTPRDVAAVEIYRRPAEVPSQWGGSDSGCGVVLIWTKRGTRR